MPIRLQRSASSASNSEFIVGPQGAPNLHPPHRGTFVLFGSGFARMRAYNPSEHFVWLEDTGGLQNMLKIGIGCRVMLRTNLDVPDGLVNGACGYIDTIDVTEDNEVTTIYTKFDGNAGQRWCTAHGTPTVGITPHTVRFMGKDAKRVRRRQFPIVFAWAKTIHKSQGATEHNGVKATLDKRVRMPGQAYVALSRAPSSELVSLTTFSPESIRTMAGIEWALNELYLQQAGAKAAQSRAAADRLAEEVLRPPHPARHYRELQALLPKPDWALYGKDAADWQDLPDDFPQMPQLMTCPRCGMRIEDTILSQRQHNRRCTGKPSRKRQPATEAQAKSSKATRRKQAMPQPTSAAPEATPLQASSATVKWTCDKLECGRAVDPPPDWFNPTQCDCVGAARTQVGASCGFLATVHIMAAVKMQPAEFTRDYFCLIGRANQDERDNFTFHTIGNFLGFHDIGLDTLLVDGATAVTRTPTFAFLLLYPYGRLSRHWIAITRGEEGRWLLCDSLHPMPFQVTST